MQLSELEAHIQWDKIILPGETSKYSRYGGKWNFFDGAAILIEHTSDADYQGDEVAAWQFPDGSIVIISDSFGSCSYCDGWLASQDDGEKDVREYIKGMVHSAKILPGVPEAIKFCKEESKRAEYYRERKAGELVPALEKLLDT